MATTNNKMLTNAFMKFASHAKHVLHIRNKQDYEKSLTLIESLFEIADDSKDDPLNDLITMISSAISEYETKSKSFSQFNKQLKQVNSDVAVLRVLMAQYNLTGGDLQMEIGSKPLVSMILSGQRNLTKEHISNLTQRFNISPALFF